MLTNKTKKTKSIHYLKGACLCLLAFVFSINFVFAQADTTKTAGQASGGAGGADLEVGKRLWEGNCTSCHAATAEVVVGPGLKGILERRTIEWLIPWVKNSQAVIKSGDKYAVELFTKYNKAVMTSFNFKDEEIKAIFAYVDQESKKVPVKVETTTGGSTGTQTSSASDSSGYFNLMLGILVMVLILIFAVLLVMLSMVSKFLKQKEDLTTEDREVVNQKFDVLAVFQNSAVLGGVALLFMLFVLKTTLDGVTNIGVQQGYAPTQPIAFSHKLHAGQYEIDCGYCHTGVYKGKSATIPSANICMNCHNSIKRGSPEIQKIYKAIENNKPIEWVRIHNLPDLAYFNHAQHTNVAGLACEKCHGEIKEMEVVQQRAPLTMGWCINCHRQTVVEHAKDNKYYDRLIEAHDKYQKGSPMTVENIGGLECAKCHY
ncbi:MAG: cytochrome C [Bacteroidetes bacterium]|nr:MAG: cytochrome C [Bacteroidota bacterium]TAG89509.1 MAG: cytochrome C [Bacteroidota bacterium]